MYNYIKLMLSRIKNLKKRQIIVRIMIHKIGVTVMNQSCYLVT